MSLLFYRFLELISFDEVNTCHHLIQSCFHHWLISVLALAPIVNVSPLPSLLQLLIQLLFKEVQLALNGLLHRGRVNNYTVYFPVQFTDQNKSFIDRVMDLVYLLSSLQVRLIEMTLQIFASVLKISDFYRNDG